MSPRFCRWSVTIASSIALFSTVHILHAAVPTSGAITYQGHLVLDGTPVNDTADFQFTLFDAETAGSVIGSPIGKNAISVENGVFLTHIDFGTTAFNSAGQWLEIAVRTPAGSGPFVTLTPRQPISATPYSLATRGITIEENGSFIVPGMRVMVASQTFNVMGGHPNNNVPSNVTGATIGGGGTSANPNRVTDRHGTVSGGVSNLAGNDNASSEDAIFATVGGGNNNRAMNFAATIGGGMSNLVTGMYATIAGGLSNTASGTYSAIAGGYENSVSGVCSMAAGYRANCTHHGSFVWADTRSAYVNSPAENSFSVSAENGIWLGNTTTPSIPAGRLINTSTNAYLSTGGVWTNVSDQSLKDGIEPVDVFSILEKTSRLPISTWHYLAEEGTARHIGPMAQDFYQIFSVGLDDTGIGTVDADGVALACIQALNQMAAQHESQLASMQQQIAQQADEIESLRRQIAASDSLKSLEQRIAELERVNLSK